jgi:hypothetical protein
MTMFESVLKLFGLSKKAKGDRALNRQIEKSMDDFITQPVYKKLTIQIIDSTSDESLLQTVFDSLSQKFSVGKDEYKTVLEFNRSQQAIYVIWELEAEVNNGGFNQYYTNSSGQFANLTPNALKLVGANKFSELVNRANRIYEDENALIKKYQDGSTEGFSKSYEDNPLNELDDEFFEYYRDENLMQLQVAFIRKNKTDFIDE